MDIGSSSTRSALFDETATPLRGSAASRQYTIRYTADGGAEINPRLLLGAAHSCINETLRARSHSRTLRNVPVAAVAGSAFWHGLLGIGAAGRPLTPIWTWADDRARDDAEKMRRQLDELAVLQRTGCMLRAVFWPAKLRWIQRTQPNLSKRVRKWVSPAEWIFAQLFGSSSLSHSMASATGLYEVRRRGWDREMCGVCQVDEKKLGPISDVAEIRKPQKLAGAKLFGAIGDGAAGNVGSDADLAGRVAINIGTSAAVRVVETGQHVRIPFGLFRYVIDDRRTLFGGAISNAGNLHRWCLRELRLTPADQRAVTSQRLAANDSITALPFWVPERAPSWPNDIGGALIGLSQSTSAIDIARAATTSAFYRLADILEEIESALGQQREIIVSGGIVRSSPDSLRVLADALGRDLRVAAEPEASLRGAAVYALKKMGHDVPRLPLGRKIRANKSFAAKHRARRQRQNELEQRLTLSR